MRKIVQVTHERAYYGALMRPATRPSFNRASYLILHVAICATVLEGFLVGGPRVEPCENAGAVRTPHTSQSSDKGAE